MKISVADLRLLVKKQINESPLIANMSLIKGIVRRLTTLKKGVESGEYSEQELLEVVEEMNDAISQSDETVSPDFLCPISATQDLSRDLSQLSYETLRQLDDISSTVDIWFQ